MQTVPCPHCSESIRPTATFCLACDRPVVDTDRGLSVAEPVPVSIGRPMLGVVVGLLCVAVLTGATYGGVRLFQKAGAAAAEQARSDVRQGLELVVSAESGHGTACHALQPVVAEPAAATLAACESIVGDDSGARLGAVSVGRPQLSSGTGTVRVRATVIDDDGSHALDETVHLVEVRKHWRMAWDGRPAVPSHRA